MEYLFMYVFFAFVQGIFAVRYTDWLHQDVSSVLIFMYLAPLVSVSLLICGIYAIIKFFIEVKMPFDI